MQISGTTANNFVTPVIYTVKAANGATANYTVTVTKAESSANAISAYSINNINGVITAGSGGNYNISVTLPFGTNLNALVATFATSGESVSITSVLQTSGVTQNNFSTSPIIYTVTAANGTQVNYNVTVTTAANTAAAITAYSINNVNGVITATGTPNAFNIAVTLPYGSSITALPATFTTTGTSIAVGVTPQVSTLTLNNFSSPVTYVVTAANGTTTASYTVTVTIAANTAAAITAYSINNVSGVITAAGSPNTFNIAVTLPYGTSVTALPAAFITTGTSVAVGANQQVSTLTLNNFSSPVIYIVTAANGTTTATYTVTVTIAANTAAAITAYSINNINGIITAAGSPNTFNIAVTLPYGTSITALPATFTTSGTSVAVGATPQVSTLTLNNFSSAITYVVTAANGTTTATYTVTVTVAANTAAAITAYSINNVNGIITATGTPNAFNIAVTLPYGTSVTALPATFTTTGTSVAVGVTPQVSTLTLNNFSSPVSYIVTAANGTTTATYTVTVTIAANTAAAITAYSINNVSGITTAGGSPNTFNIAVTLPYGTSLTALPATFTTTGTSITVGVTPQVSTLTLNNFSSPVTYIVTAANGTTTATYTVTVTIAANTAAAITAYSINNISGVITAAGSPNTFNIAVTLPYGTSVTALPAAFITTGTSVAVGATSQISTLTLNNFSTPVTYIVTAADGTTTATYTVTVTIAANTAAAITGYSINNVNGIITATGTPNVFNIAVTLPYGTSITALPATFTTTGTSVAVGVTPQVSTLTLNNFSSPVSYIVTAANGTTTATYIVTVTIAANTAAAITAYSINNVSGIITVAGSPNTFNIAVTLPYGTSVTSLPATFTTTGTSVAVGATPQVSTLTLNNFSSPVTYIVTAANGTTTATYTVTVTIAANTAAAITSYSILNIDGIITGTNIAITLPFGTSESALVATFTTSGAGVTVASPPVNQVSGITQNNFSAPLLYTVTAANGTTTAIYTVTVTIAANTATAFTNYSIGNVNGVITGTNIVVTLPYGTESSALIATYTTAGTGVTVDGVTQVSGNTSNNYTSPPLSYLVTAADGTTTVTYTVTVVIAANTAKNITAFSINGRNGVISGESIVVGLPFGTESSSLIASFTITGTGATVESVLQVSGSTANNFESPVFYVVTASDSSTQVYSVTVNVSTMPNALHIFLTAETSTGNLMAAANAAGAGVANGIAGADFLCQADAQCPTGATCKAMIVSLGVLSPAREATPTLIDWPLQANTTYYNMSEAPIGITDGTSLLPPNNTSINLTNSIVSANPPQYAWTALNGVASNTWWTSFTTSPNPTCMDWTGNVADATTVGYPGGFTNYQWISNSLLCNSVNHLYCVQQASIINIYAGIVSAPGIPVSGALAIASNLTNPQGIAVDSNDNVYIADTGNSLVEKVNSSTGIITIIAGGGGVAISSANQGNIGTHYILSSPKGVAVDSSGNVYIADTTDQFIEKINASTGILTIIAGNGSSGTPILGAATGSPLNLPQGVAVDSSNNIYIADTGNSLIEEVNSATGILSIIAGKLNGSGAVNPGLPTPGPATNSQLNLPHGVAVDSGNNIYIADTNNDVAEKITSGNLAILAGVPGIAGTPSAGPATSSHLNQPGKIAVSSIGNVYIADTLNNDVEQVTTAGVLSLFAGIGGGGAAPTPGGPATNSALNNPNGVTVYGSGNVYISDTLNDVIEKAN